MAETPIRIMFQGKKHDGVLLDGVSAQDHFHELHLSDGSVSKVKLVATGVIKLDHIEDSLGFPTYLLQSSTALSVVQGPTPENESTH